MMEYKVVALTDYKTLSIEVSHWINNAWSCQGGVSVSHVHTNPAKGVVCMYAQAMIKHPTNEGEQVAPTR